MENPAYIDLQGESTEKKYGLRTKLAALGLAVTMAACTTGGEAESTTTEAPAQTTTTTELETTTTESVDEEVRQIGSLPISKYEFKGALYINQSNIDNFDDVYGGNVILEDNVNPASLLAYHYLNIYGAMCTGDTQRFLNQYNLEGVDVDSLPQDDEITIVLDLIDKFREKAGTTLYDPYEVGCHGQPAFDFLVDQESLREVVWSSDNSRVEFLVEKYDPNDSQFQTAKYSFIKVNEDHWVDDGSDFDINS